MKKNKLGISRREFATRDGCDESIVRRKIKSGHLPTLADDTLDPALVGTAWRGEVSDQALEDKAKEIVSANGFVIPQKATSEAKKEAYLAELRKLEYDEAAGLVVDRSEIMAIIVAELSNVRTRLLQLPNRAAPKAALVNGVNQIQRILEDEVALVLDLLTADVKSKK